MNKLIIGKYSDVIRLSDYLIFKKAYTIITIGLHAKSVDFIICKLTLKNSF